MSDVKWYLGGGGASPTFWICSLSCIADSPDDVDLVDDCVLVTPDKGARCGICNRVAVFDFPIELHPRMKERMTEYIMEIEDLPDDERETVDG